MEPGRLGRHTMRDLTSPENELWLSPISTWEALTLNRKGRIQLQGDLKDWLADATVNMREAPLTHEIVLTANSLVLHSDPADRFLAATAKVFDLTLVTADQNLLGLGDIATRANR